MATYTYNSSTTTRNSNASAENFTFDISSAITAAKIPAYAKVTKVTINVWGDIDTATSRGKMTASFGSTSLCSSIWAGGSAGEVPSGEKDITSYFHSENANAGKLKDSSVRLKVTLDGPVMIAKFNHTVRYQVYFEWQPPVTATFKDYDGTVLKTQTVVYGKTPTAPSNPTRSYDFQYTYSFKGWDKTIGAITTNTTYTAQYTATLREFDVTVNCLESVSGEKCTVSGEGRYKYGDTVTLKVEYIPPNHKFSFWRFIETYETEILVFTIDESFSNHTYDLIDFDCHIENTGYLIKAVVLPNDDAGVVYDGDIIDGYHYKGNAFTPEGFVHEYLDPNNVVYAEANEGYKFVKWSDGVTANPRGIIINADATYTAIFEKLPPEFTSASMTYLNKQISSTNKVICNEGFIISVGIT